MRQRRYYDPGSSPMPGRVPDGATSARVGKESRQIRRARARQTERMAEAQEAFQLQLQLFKRELKRWADGGKLGSPPPHPVPPHTPGGTA